MLGKKLSLLILRDIAVYKVDRFNRLLESLPGISPKVLATRLKELQQEGLIWPVENRKSHPMIVRWSLTEKGMDVVAILMMVMARSGTRTGYSMTRSRESCVISLMRML